MTCNARKLLEQQRRLQREHIDSSKAYVHKAIADVIESAIIDFEKTNDSSNKITDDSDNKTDDL